MITFAKAQAASFIASVVDYLLTILMVELFGVVYYLASAVGTVCGGLTHFSISRIWVFDSREKKKSIQLIHYSLVWFGYLLLMTGGVYVLTHYAGINYVIAKLVLSLVMAIGYNYPIQKYFVFKKTVV